MRWEGDVGGRLQQPLPANKRHARKILKDRERRAARASFKKLAKAIWRTE